MKTIATPTIDLDALAAELDDNEVIDMESDDIVIDTGALCTDLDDPALDLDEFMESLDDDFTDEL